jgi:hypothetical protein
VARPTYRFTPMAPGYDLGAFDCGEDTYNKWLTNAAMAAVAAGTAGVYLLLEESPGPDPTNPRVRGYYAICPTSVVRAHLPRSVTRSVPDPVPGFLLAKLARDTSLQGDREARWGTQLVAAALRRIVAAADLSGGRVVVVDVDNEGLLPFYEGHSFLPTGVDPLRLYMKVATARKLLGGYDA